MNNVIYIPIDVRDLSHILGGQELKRAPRCRAEEIQEEADQVEAVYRRQVRFLQETFQAEKAALDEAYSKDLAALTQRTEGHIIALRAEADEKLGKLMQELDA